MRKLLFIASAALLVLMVFSGLLMTPGIAHAASVQAQTHATALTPMHPLIPAVTCSGSGCNGLDPYATGCGNSRKFVTSTDFTDPATGVESQVDLEFSTVCGTNWTEIHPINATGNQCLDGEITRESGPDGEMLSFFFSSCQFTFINTDQVFSPTNKAQACALGALSNDFVRECTAAV